MSTITITINTVRIRHILLFLMSFAWGYGLNTCSNNPSYSTMFLSLNGIGITVLCGYLWVLTNNSLSDYKDAEQKLTQLPNLRESFKMNYRKNKQDIINSAKLSVIFIILSIVGVLLTYFKLDAIPIPFLSEKPIPLFTIISSLSLALFVKSIIYAYDLNKSVTEFKNDVYDFVQEEKERSEMVEKIKGLKEYPFKPFDKNDISLRVQPLKKTLST